MNARPNQHAITMLYGLVPFLVREEGHLEAAPQRREPGGLFHCLPPRNGGHLAGVDVRIDTRLAQAGDVAEHVDGVVRHAQVRVNPVPACRQKFGIVA